MSLETTRWWGSHGWQTTPEFIGIDGTGVSGAQECSLDPEPRAFGSLPKSKDGVLGQGCQGARGYFRGFEKGRTACCRGAKRYHTIRHVSATVYIPVECWTFRVDYLAIRLQYHQATNSNRTGILYTFHLTSSLSTTYTWSINFRSRLFSPV
jgi:hypothetical protein